jgi:hypothetical protein
MEVSEYNIRTIFAENFCNRAVQVYKRNPGMEKYIDQAARQSASESLEKLAQQGKITLENLPREEERLKQMIVGIGYIQKHFIGIVKEWAGGKKFYERSYLKELESLNSLKNEVLESIKEDIPDSQKAIEKKNIVGEINLIERKLTIYICEALDYLQRKDNIIDALMKENKLPDDNMIRTAVIKEHPTPVDYIQNYQNGFSTASKLNHLLTNLPSENKRPQLIININDYLMKIFEENFIKADVDWLY